MLPSLVHYLVLRRLGATPHRVKWGEWGNALFFVTWWRTPHHRFARGQFVAAYCLPSAILCAKVLVYVYTAPEAAPVLAFVLPFHLGNFWFTSLVSRAPEGTVAEPYEGGLRLYGPPVPSSRSGATGGSDGYASG